MFQRVFRIVKKPFILRDIGSTETVQINKQVSKQIGDVVRSNIVSLNVKPDIIKIPVVLTRTNIDIAQRQKSINVLETRQINRLERISKSRLDQNVNVVSLNLNESVTETLNKSISKQVNIVQSDVRQEIRQVIANLSRYEQRSLSRVKSRLMQMNYTMIKNMFVSVPFSADFNLSGRGIPGYGYKTKAWYQYKFRMAKMPRNPFAVKKIKELKF